MTGLSPLNLLANPSLQEVSQIKEGWLHHQPEQIERLAYSDRAKIHQNLTEYGEAELASSRTKELLPKIHQSNPATKNLIKTVLTFVGALTFSAAPQLLASGSARGPLAISAGILGGGAATFFVDDLAVKGVTKKRRRHSTKEARFSLERQHAENPAQNELVDVFFEGQKARLVQVERENLETDFIADLALAGVLSVVEGATAFVLILPGGLGMALLAAGFPVALTWAAVLFQSDRFDYPEYCATLLENYSDFLPEPEVSEEESRQVQRLDYSFKYVAEGDLSGRLKNLGMARADFDIQYADKKIKQLEKQGLEELDRRRKRHREELKCLPDQWQMPAINVAGHAPTENLHAEFEQKKAAWIEAKKRELEALYEEDVQMIICKYKQQIQQWQAEKARAEREYGDAGRRV